MNKLLTIALLAGAALGIAGVATGPVSLDSGPAQPVRSPITAPLSSPAPEPATVPGSASGSIMDDVVPTGLLPASAVSPTGAKPLVLRGFKPGTNNWNPGHRGVDLVVFAGQEIRAATSGTVIYAGRLNDRSLISIEHGDGLRTTYEPVSALVKRGDAVTEGQVIGTVESGHCGDGTCLHWGAKYGSDGYIDPMSLLEPGPVRLYE